ncbi:crotonase/enoyl-CoA hydratase family protein [Halopseudomonas nanhaiensis]|uniref:crotonase/enoyl-CoA hydratase family protein n=1 Tax=Halopseudomonas nanhaiensis TaxID=2830842 RepID=UPI001CC0B7A9|nr:crotonase/enoyl-CoA hydratase family protein [Halopseudomonas nanhaiensis]UAW97022.1 crotonase/enoyl-CoA hydratase family protein [Halopseudomonas nanhaiensis]
MTEYTSLRVTQQDRIAHIQINRPAKFNAMDSAFWTEMITAFEWVDVTESIRVVVISGAGDHFSAGIDLALLAQASSRMGKDIGRNAEVIRGNILRLQEAFNAVDRCRKPVIAAIHGYCLGGAIDLISACDMRYCTPDARFGIKEIDMGMAADVGTLQRLPHLIGDGMMRELAYTGRVFDGHEAARIGLVNCVHDDVQALMQEVMSLAGQIASKSPLAIRGTKEMIRYARDHSVEDGLNYIASWNAAMLQSEDLKVAMAAHMAKKPAEFAD